MPPFLAIGNEAVGWGALQANCEAFFGYPITPQNETAEWFAREFPARGKVFLQAPSETSAINMVFGGASTGARVMTSTSSPGWGLMQETMSHLVNAELPCVVVLVQRGGPGQGTTRHAQMDYLSVTRGGGQGGYKNLVLAPASVQETHDLVQLAFHLAEKYRNPVVVLSDGVIGLTMEYLEVKTLDFGPLPPKDWAIEGTEKHPDSLKHYILCAQGLVSWPPYQNYLSLLEALNKKYQAMAQEELRYETWGLEDARLILVAYGYTSRVCRAAALAAREQGLPVGLVRPITLWPFPYEVIRQKAHQGVPFLVVEDSLGQFVDDVRFGAEGRSPVHFLGVLARHTPQEMGLIFPERVLEEIRRVL